MAERLVRNVALTKSPDEWYGALKAEDETIWVCEHKHDNDIEAEFCSLDMLLMCKTLANRETE